MSELHYFNFCCVMLLVGYSLILFGLTFPDPKRDFLGHLVPEKFQHRKCCGLLPTVLSILLRMFMLLVIDYFLDSG